MTAMARADMANLSLVGGVASGEGRAEGVRRGGPKRPRSPATKGLEPGFAVSGRRGGLSRSIAAFGEREADDEHSLGGARIQRHVPNADRRYRQLVTPCVCHSHLPEADRSPDSPGRR